MTDGWYHPHGACRGRCWSGHSHQEQSPRSHSARSREIPLAQFVERLFSKLKNWHRVATRYDKTPESYLGFVTLASIKPWLPFVHDA